MNENDKILINTYLDGETSEDESKYIESLLESNKEANDFANNIKRANSEINSYFNSSEFKDLESNIDKFIEKQKKKSAKSSFNFNDFFSNPRYYGFAASAFLLVIILVPTFTENRSDNSTYSISSESASFLEEILQSTSNKTLFDNLPVYKISSERDTADSLAFKEIFNAAVLEYATNSIWIFKIQSDESTLIVQIDDLKNNCYSGTVIRVETSDIREFQVCKE
tara:strand:- start:566 stop:1237 length:672 start_codon:yes stop_codon:yes gene_type:complete